MTITRKVAESLQESGAGKFRKIIRVSISIDSLKFTLKDLDARECAKYAVVYAVKIVGGTAILTFALFDM